MSVSLRPVRRGDLPLFFLHQCDAGAAAMAGFTPRPRAAFDTHWDGILTRPDCTVATVEVDDRPVGYVATFPRDGGREIAFWLDRSVWNRGVGRQAVATFVGQHAERPLFATVIPTNTASLALLRGCGFRVIGREGGPDAEPELLLRLD